VYSGLGMRGGSASRRRFLCGLASLPAARMAAAAEERGRLGRTGPPSGAAAPLMIGDVGARSAVLWTRAEPGVRVEFRVREAAGGAKRVEGLASSEAGGTVHVPLTGLAPGGRVRVELTHRSASGQVLARADGAFSTAAGPRAPIRFAWSGDLAGQGYGIDPARGGYFGFDALAADEPDFFVFSGDTVYADQPVRASLELDDGTIWRNVTTLAKSTVAETLEQFRGQYRYNWLDPHFARFFRTTPVVAQWDDHEVRNNWFPGRPLDDDPRYRVGDCTVLAARARRAFDEAFPRTPAAEGRIFRRVPRGPLLDVFVVDARTYRTSNDRAGHGPHAFWGTTQSRWLVRAIAESKALWKVVACDMPLGLVVPDGPARSEAVADGQPGAPRFREVELNRVLSAVAAHGARNVVFLTADVHYAAAHRYRKPFPFWEFVAGPLHAGQFGPNELDPTFGPVVEFANRDRGDPQNAPPSPRSTSYGVVEIEPRGGAMTVLLRDGGGRTLHRQRLRPDPRG